MSSQLSLPAICLFKDAASIARQLDAALLAQRRAGGADQGHQPGFDVECSGVTAMDSSLIALLLDAKRRAQLHSQTLTFSNPPINLQRLAKLYGLDALLFADSVDVSQ